MTLLSMFEILSISSHFLFSHLSLASLHSLVSSPSKFLYYTVFNVLLLLSIFLRIASVIRSCLLVLSFSGTTSSAPCTRSSMSLLTHLPAFRTYFSPSQSVDLLSRIFSVWKAALVGYSFLASNFSASLSFSLRSDHCRIRSLHLGRFLLG